MTRDETKRLIQAMATAWPNYRPPNLTDVVNLWASLFASYPYEVVSKALQVYMMQDNAFAPSPGQLVALIPTGDTGRRSELEAWSLVRKALRNGTYGAETEYAKLPEDVQRAVGSPAQIRAWAAAPEEETETVMQSNFLRSYRAVQEQIKQEERYGKIDYAELSRHADAVREIGQRGDD